MHGKSSLVNIKAQKRLYTHIEFIYGPRLHNVVNELVNEVLSSNSFIHYLMSKSESIWVTYAQLFGRNRQGQVFAEFLGFNLAQRFNGKNPSFFEQYLCTA